MFNLCVCGVCVCMCQVHKRYNEGSLERARLASRQAKHWSAVAIVTGSIVWTVLAVTISVVLVLKVLASWYLTQFILYAHESRNTKQDLKIVHGLLHTIYVIMCIGTCNIVYVELLECDNEKYNGKDEQ